jgi:RNA polymerase sigma-70 factor (ECF subfamily)
MMQGLAVLVAAANPLEHPRNSGVPEPTEVINALAQRLQAERSRHLRYLRSRLPSLSDAEDALQDAALKLIRRAAALAVVEKPDAWVATSLRHTVIDRYRRAGAQRRLTDALAAEPSEGPDPKEDETRTAAECMTATLPQLKAEYGTLLRKVYLEGTPLEDVAQLERLTANNAAVRLHRARGALRETLQRQCKTCVRDDCWARGRFAPPAGD